MSPRPTGQVSSICDPEGRPEIPGGLDNPGRTETPLPARGGKGNSRDGYRYGSFARPEAVDEHLQLEDRVWLLRAMLLMRGLEERAMSLYRQGKVPGSFYDGFGQEAVSAGPAFAMAPADRLCILHRDLAAHIVPRGHLRADPRAVHGRAAGITGGRDGNVHFGDWRSAASGWSRCCPT